MHCFICMTSSTKSLRKKRLNYNEWPHLCISMHLWKYMIKSVSSLYFFPIFLYQIWPFCSRSTLTDASEEIPHYVIAKATYWIALPELLSQCDTRKFPQHKLCRRAGVKNGRFVQWCSSLHQRNPDLTAGHDRLSDILDGKTVMLHDMPRNKFW